MQCVPNNETICQLCDHCFGTGLGDEAMDVENFYSIVAGTCFTLVGIWWGVVQYRQDWLKDDVKRRLAGGIYVSFLLPGVMALGAQIGGENKLIWRAVFSLAALLGMFYTLALMARTAASGKQGFFRRNRWIVILLYMLVLVFGAVPELARPLGLLPLQVEGFLLALLILIAHALAWEFMTEPKPEAPRP